MKLENPPSVQSHTYAIKETARLSKIPPYVLRYWEKKNLLRPSHTSRGHRRFSQQDIERIMKIYDLIYVKGMRTEGVRRFFIDENRKKNALQELPLELASQTAMTSLLEETKSTLRGLLQILK